MSGSCPVSYDLGTTWLDKKEWFHHRSAWNLALSTRQRKDIDRDMLRIRLAVATRRFGQSLKQALQTAGHMGVQGVQLDVRQEVRPAELSEAGRRQFLRKVAEWRLEIASLYYPNQRSFFDPEHLDARIAGIKNALHLAHQLKTPTVVARLGQIPRDCDCDDYQRLTDVLNELAGYGNHVGATLALTPGSNPPQTVAQLIAAITNGPIGISYDPAQWMIAGADPLTAMRELHASIVHIQARDAIRDIDGAGMEVPIGDGDVDWHGVLALAEEATFRGWMTVDRVSGDDPIGDLIRSVTFIKRVVLGG
jgi:sugar phosphate isomerase/epimerase